MTEQLYGGALDGLEVETVSTPEYFILHTGARYVRRRDGKLYEASCRWDDEGQWRQAAN